MSRRKQPYQKKEFESTGASSDTSANVYMSMLLSPAWKDLTANQQRLYLVCKAQYYAEKQKPNSDPLCFTMNQSKWADLYGLYKRNNAAIENYKYCEMPKKKEDILTIKLLTGAGEIQGIRFESKDNGETWAYAGISVE